MDKRKKGWLQLALVVMVGVVAVGVSEWIASLAETPAPRDRVDGRVLSVSAQRIEPAPHRIAFSVTGTVQVKSYVDLVAEVSGRVIEVDRSIFPGEHFSKDTTLFQIEPEDYRLALENQRAAVARARRSLELQRAESETAKRQWRRLHPDQEPPALVAKIPQLEEASAALEAAESRLRRAKLDLERTRFSLPFDGRVVDSNLEKGQFVTAGQRYGRVYRDDALEVKAPVTGRQQRWLATSKSPDMTIEIVEDGEPKAYRGAFSRMAAEAEPQTRLLSAIFSFVDPPTTVLPGQFAEVEVAGPEVKDAWVLPVSALQAKDRAFLIDDENRLREIALDVLNVTDEHVVAKSDGEPITVVTQALRNATPGTKVEVHDVQ